jgi:hypothetical protein
MKRKEKKDATNVCFNHSIFEEEKMLPIWYGLNVLRLIFGQ